MTTPTPIHILSGFLGSGKTTLLQKAIDYCNEAGLKPAVIMNEIGDINLDGLLIEAEAAVFIGESFPKETVKAALERL